MVLEKTLESTLDCKEIQPVHSKGDQSWVLFGRNDAKAETSILWPPHAKSWLIGRDSDAGRDWGQEEKGITEDEMAGWHHRLNGHEFGWTLGVGDGQGGLVCCSSWGRKESDTTERLNWTEWSCVNRILRWWLFVWCSLRPNLSALLYLLGVHLYTCKMFFCKYLQPTAYENFFLVMWACLVGAKNRLEASGNKVFQTMRERNLVNTCSSFSIPYLSQLG